MTGRVLQEPCLRARFFATRADAGGATALWTGATLQERGERADDVTDWRSEGDGGLARRVPQGRGYYALRAVGRSSLSRSRHDVFLLPVALPPGQFRFIERIPFASTLMM